MRTIYCGKVRIKHVDQNIFLCGWVHNLRNFGNLIFIDIRDYTGIVQIVFDSKNSKLFYNAQKLTIESCIKIEGIVKTRSDKNINVTLSTGNIEIIVKSLHIFNIAEPLPLNYHEINKEAIRLKYRYLDLRQSKNMQIFFIRNKVIHWIHNFMYKNNFIYLDTPILTKSTPEGARDYLVPSRNYPGNFYALPQSPQLFKQLLMISGFDRYYQIAKCFRDEDLRSNRQPEFTQIDLEMSFTNAKQIRTIVETMISTLWMSIKTIKLEKFPILDFKDAMEQYGTDKPDLRNPIKLIEIAELFDNYSQCFIFRKYQFENSRIAAIKIPSSTKLSIKKIYSYISYVAKYSKSKLFYFKFDLVKLKNQTSKNFIKILWDRGILHKIISKLSIQDGDVVFFMGDKTKIVNKSLSKLRLKIGQDLHLTNNLLWKPVWITNFPLFTTDKCGKLSSTHHPFTAPRNRFEKKIFNNPEKIISDAYDLVINGYELGGGSVRIDDIKLQKKVFKTLGITKEIQQEKFGFFLEALKFGTPPHAGIALGLDRIIMLLTNTMNIKDVILFPKTTESNCLITNAPSIINQNILKELSIEPCL